MATKKQPDVKQYAGNTSEAEKPYYIVNPAGAIHIVSREHASARLRQVGYRMASKEERAALDAAKGHQVAGKPLARPYSPDPDEQIDLVDEA